MTEVDITQDASSSLVLRRCPRCEYDLNGLPDEGICPECGRAYDQKSIILFGQPSGAQAKAANKSIWRQIVPLVLLVALLVHQTRRSRPFSENITFIAIGTFLAAHVGLLLARRLFEVVPKFSQVRINEKGIVQLNQGEIATPSMWAGLAWMIMAGAGMVVLGVGIRPLATNSALIWIGLCMLSAGVALIPRMKNPARPVPWRQIETIDVDRIGGKVAHIMTKGYTYWGPIKVNRQQAVDIKVPLSDDGADELVSRIASYRQAGKV